MGDIHDKNIVYVVMIQFYSSIIYVCVYGERQSKINYLVCCTTGIFLLNQNLVKIQVS